MKKIDNNYVFTEEELLEYSKYVALLQKAESYQEIAHLLVTDNNGEIIESGKELIDKSESVLDYLVDDTNIFETTSTRGYTYTIDEIVNDISLIKG